MKKFIFKFILQPIRIWIEITLRKNKSATVSVASLSFPRLNEIFPDELLNSTNVVITENIPIPFITFLNKVGIFKLKKIQGKVPLDY